ncbi:MAG: hypothetical protein L0Y54_22515, partial [Sporichthyaceae bacterium]|nr:hypothetical protein [Sporichthyaceae bacterium]
MRARAWIVLAAGGLAAVGLFAVPIGVAALAATPVPTGLLSPARGQSLEAFRDATDGVRSPLPNLRTPAEAIAYARAATLGPGIWYRRCLAFTARSYGWHHSGSPTALSHWLTLPAAYRHPGERTIPAGAILYWNIGAAGHAALYLGNGLIASND